MSDFIGGGVGEAPKTLTASPLPDDGPPTASALVQIVAETEVDKLDTALQDVLKNGLLVEVQSCAQPMRVADRAQSGKLCDMTPTATTAGTQYCST